MSKVIQIDNLSKQYRLGLIGTGTISHDLNRWWHQVRGKEDPYLKIGQVNNRAQKGSGHDYVWALRDINIEVEEGEVLGIIGKNGAGKSTLLKLLSKVTRPTTGEIRSRGRIASLLEVGTGFHPEMTGRENIYMNGTIMGMRKWEIDRKLDEIVDFSGIAKYLDTPTKRYSSGMTVRLGFSIAAHLEPEILVVDEVLAVGDAEFQKKAIGKMQDVSSKQGRTVLFVSHNMGSIKSLCDKGILLENGKITKSDSILKVIDEYIKINNDLNPNRSLVVNFKNENNTEQAFFKKIELNKNIFISKEPLTINLCINTSINHSNVLIAIAINDRSDNTIFHLANSIVEDEKLTISPGVNTVEFTIPILRLKEGQYNITIFLSSNGQILDWKKNAISFMVEESSIYEIKSGFQLQGLIQTDFSFKKCI